jgi:hypothetical protein
VIGDTLLTVGAGILAGAIWRAASAAIARATTCDIIYAPYGTTTASTLDRVSQMGGGTTRLVANRASVPRIGHAFSSATGADAEALAAQAVGQNQYVFNVPNALLDELKRVGLAVESKTNFRGVVGTEIRILPQATEYILRFLEK